jgi:hypothetical protein
MSRGCKTEKDTPSIHCFPGSGTCDRSQTSRKAGKNWGSTTLQTGRYRKRNGR